MNLQNSNFRDDIIPAVSVLGAVVGALSAQPWWLTVCLTVIACVWIAAKTWRQRPPTIHVPPYTMPDSTTHPYSITLSQSPPPHIPSEPPSRASMVDDVNKPLEDTRP